MGVDLRLLVVDGQLDTWGHAHTILEFGRNYDAMDAIEDKCAPQPRKGWELHSFVAKSDDGESYYGTVDEDNYGEPLKYVAAGELSAALADCSEMSDRQRAAVAYVSALRPETLIALHWH